MVGQTIPVTSAISSVSSQLLQTVINVGFNTCVEIFGSLRRIPAQLPTTITPSASIGSHLQKCEPVRLGVQVRSAQPNSLGRNHFSTSVKILGDRLDESELLVLSTLEEVVTITTRSRPFSRYDGVEEDVVELANFKCINQRRSPQDGNLHTFINMHVRPDVLAFTDIDGFAQLDSHLDPARDLEGVRFLETLLYEVVVGKAPNRGRKDDPGPHVPCVGQRLTVQRYRTTAPPYLLQQR